ncbi:DUF2254 domain-containing protein [Thalassotalea sp. PP2-459]|uniref:DUF2254 domain-containing protein n=1 Tax=Thalassotalea sp. PP2-459 TaxID=1742724 RepID=UPI000942155D|nr:DUF2254 domain-containing protein [Thalassotalea sp. PP2-459]OKY26201.1 hypothetical protein BI291_13050 [Thalassotalea sp. PP2-459]
MNSIVSLDRLRFLLHRLGEKLWVRPLVVCLLSIALVFAAKIIDGYPIEVSIPDVTKDSVETLLSLLSASMLVIATFSVSSMVSAYFAASNSATPRSFKLVLADDVSQNALSTFVGAFIFSVVALTAVKNAFYDKAGLFVIFVLTMIVFAMVVVTFVRWVDSIARLGLVGSTIDKVEQATKAALIRRRDKPTLGGLPISNSTSKGEAVFTEEIGYVQLIDMAKIQCWAEKVKAHVEIAVLPGAFTSAEQPLAYVNFTSTELAEVDYSDFFKSFSIGNDRTFEDDPRFGVIALSEIAARALSPAVNDPGTAIKVTGTLVRLISLINEPSTENSNLVFDRVFVPEIKMSDLFNDAFTAIARDGASSVEVCVCLQKGLSSLESLSNESIREQARYHKKLALKRAYNALDIEEDIAAVNDAANENNVE